MRKRQPNGAVRFREAVEGATARALAFPKSGPPYLAKTRRVFVRGYPFFLVYREETWWHSRVRARTRVASTGLLGITCPLTPQRRATLFARRLTRLRTARLAANVRPLKGYGSCRLRRDFFSI